MSASEKEIELMDLIEMALIARGIEDLSERVLSGIAGMTQSEAVFLYIADSRFHNPQFFQQGFQPEAASAIEKLCQEQFDHIASQSDKQPVSLSPSLNGKIIAEVMLYPLHTNAVCVGLIGLTENGKKTSHDLLEKLFNLLANSIDRVAHHVKTERELLHLNQYLTVSSMLAQSMDLHELLEITLQCCMEAVSAEASSVLLLDDKKENFQFYHVAGPAKLVLMSATFPADKGLAGAVMETEQSEIINDVAGDPRFYGKIDSESGFHTRNMIAIPLVASSEKVGVLEVLNKANGVDFTEEDHLLMMMIAEEIAFAIRNAKLFEYVVNSYCKQRQGQASCKGCKRPLGSWTPCVKYRESAI